MPILLAWSTILRDEGYSQECINILYSNNTELDSLGSKLEWSVGDICRLKDMAGTQSNRFLFKISSEIELDCSEK